MRVVLASGNAGKLREFSALLAPARLSFEPQSAFGIEPPAETGSTFVENALLKARHAAAVAQLPALADDSGLEVDALGGAPGVQSARYAGSAHGANASDAANRDKLLAARHLLPATTARTARFRCAIVLVRSAEDRQPLIAEGVWEGSIVNVPRGREGFGYDPLFADRESGLTAAELPADVKNARSHRGKAVAALLAMLAATPAASWPAAALRSGDSMPLGVYVHFPWCVSKCPYCDFNSFALRDVLPEQRYIDALARDLDAQLASPIGRAAAVADASVVSVFLGGGTPSLFSPDAIGRVLAALAARLRFEPTVEVTLEANPGTIERGRFAGYAAAGVNRVSLGAQSFDAAALRRLGRIHQPEDTQRAAAELHAAGLGNFNLDLMYGLPGHGVVDAVRDVEQALLLQPAHLSHYSLTMEPGTPFAAQPPEGLPDDDALQDMLQHCQALLRQAGFERYEVSAYARGAARRSRHNTNYWEFGDYLGLGAGAHGKLTVRAGGAAALVVHRTLQPREPRRYLAAYPDAALGTTAPPGLAATMLVTPVAADQLPFEFMVNALRLASGVPLALFGERTGLALQQIEPALQGLEARGLLERNAGSLRATARGFDFLNDALLEFLPAAPRQPGYAQGGRPDQERGDYGAFHPS